MVIGVCALVALPARRVVHTCLPGPPSARKEAYGATVGGLGRGPYTAGALRGKTRDGDADAHCSLVDPPYGQWQYLG